MSVGAEALATAGVIGGGTMGAGIAQILLGIGCTVLLHDTLPDQAHRARGRIEAGLRRWQTKGQLASADEALGRLALCGGMTGISHCEWVFEAISEDRQQKEDLFRTLGRLCRPEAVLASNTSSISITALGAASGRPELTIGMHFFNPPPVMRLVEVVPGLRTDSAITEAATALARRLGKTPIISRDRPGFLSNRILAPMLNEAFWALEEGVGTAEDIDQVMKLGMNHPMGPLELADLIGLDVCLAILEVLQRETGDPKFRPSPLLRKYVEAGWLGRKTGQGFFIYQPSQQ